MHCKLPLTRAGSFAPSVGLLTRSSLFGDGPVSTGALTFRSVSRFPDGMATTKQQTMDIYFIRQSETRVDDDVNTNTPLTTSYHHNHYRTPPPIFMYYSSYCSFGVFVFIFCRKDLISSVRVRCSV
ncbi:hypothetical protein T09_2551 [Trichinella sp. T9]|nr:hypothetical protein T09_2551 [Trichinella sp. T9]